MLLRRIQFRRNPRNVVIILCNAFGRSEIDEMLREDIFYREKLVNYNIFEFIPTKYALMFEKFFCREHKTGFETDI